uniref:G-protein coupled receptors family 1 profile domain-containing protein n=1 Tax=Leptobrachium leishanense TaxID=445787 RepID=A0A8C5LZ50_9ANUR
MAPDWLIHFLAGERSLCQSLQSLRSLRTLCSGFIEMVNSTAPFTNTTLMPVTSRNIIAELFHVWLGLLSLVLFCFSFFLYFFTVILKVYFTSPHVRENARYVLFAHMLINDTLYIISGLVLMLYSIFIVSIPVPICYTLFTLSSTTFRVTPFNLAAMSLERYIAICFPLRHITLCTPQRSYVAIALIWVAGIMPNVVDILILSASVERSYFSLYIICKQELILVNPLQSTMRTLTFILTLAQVFLVIIFTYVNVMLVARQFGSGSSSASKAGKTVMLHAFQLFLCMLSLTSSISEYVTAYNSVYKVINFLILMCLPRFLSPLIYGLRDEVFSKCIRKMYSLKV